MCSIYLLFALSNIMSILTTVCLVYFWHLFIITVFVNKQPQGTKQTRDDSPQFFFLFFWVTLKFLLVLVESSTKFLFSWKCLYLEQTCDQTQFCSRLFISLTSHNQWLCCSACTKVIVPHRKLKSKVVQKSEKMWTFKWINLEEVLVFSTCVIFS